MTIQEKINKKIEIAEKRILELTKSNNLVRLDDKDRYLLSKFYQIKSENRLKTAKLIFNASKENKDDYRDYAEVVAASYYAMYYIIHSFLALKYKTKLKELVRGVHAITEHVILYYLVKTKKLAQHLYEEYLSALKTTAQINKLSPEDFQEQAFGYAEKYDKVRSDRETFTYNVTPSIEEFHAKQAIDTAEEFISTVKGVME